MQAHEAYIEDEPCLTWYIKQKQDDYYDVMKDPRQSSGVRLLNTRLTWKWKKNIDALYKKPQ